MIRLTDEEIGEVMGLPYPLEEDLEHENYAVVDIQDLHPLAKAQLKKVVEWGDDLCLEHANKQVINVYKRECPQCWQALLEEVK